MRNDDVHFLQSGSESLFNRIGSFFRRAFVAAWREGITLVFHTTLEDPGEPGTGKGRKVKTIVKTKRGEYPEGSSRSTDDRFLDKRGSGGEFYDDDDGDSPYSEQPFPR